MERETQRELVTAELQTESMPKEYKVSTKTPLKFNVIMYA